MDTMELARRSSAPRSSSIPRYYARIPRKDARFTPAEAGQLVVQLLALDRLLRSVPVAQHGALDFGSIARPSDITHSAAASDAPRDLLVLIEDFPRPDLIPATYVEAYRAVLAGRPYLNEYRVTDFKKGHDPTCSQVLRIISRIDEMLDTSLRRSFDAVNDTVRPFPFLELPAELRLHVYSYLLPREPHLALFDQPNRTYLPPRLNLVDTLCTCHQIYNEVIKYFYKNRILFMKAVRKNALVPMSPEHVARNQESIASMNPRTQLLFKQLEIQVDYADDKKIRVDRYTNDQLGDGTSSFADLLRPLENVDTIVISFPPYSPNPVYRLIFSDRKDTVQWLLDNIPETYKLLWDFTFWPDADGKQMVTSAMEKRGGLLQVQSISQRVQYNRR